jgi:DNA adenine methylase
MTSPIRWLGGKTLQLKIIIPYLTKALRTREYFIEPFLGGGSILIALLKQNLPHIKFRCSDSNDVLIRMFKEIQDSPEELMEKLDQIAVREDYYEVRKEFNQKQTVEHFIYLNKRCFRGLYRVNKSGEFNVSCSTEKNVVFYCRDNIMELNRLFNEFDVQFETKDYLDVVIEENSVVYMDPIYYGMFDEYSAKWFNHLEYVDVLNSLNDVKLFHSNSHLFREVYSNEKYIEIPVRDKINSKNPHKIRLEYFYYY